MIKWERLWAYLCREEGGGKERAMRFPKRVIARIIIPAVLIYALFMLAEATEKRAEGEALLLELRQEAESIRRYNERLRREIEQWPSDEAIASVARERFGLVFPDEKVFYDPSN